MPDNRADLFRQYQSLCNKLKKKRILKKPNLAEASQQFVSPLSVLNQRIFWNINIKATRFNSQKQLGACFERENLPQYAGLCYQSAAKCHNSLGSITEEGHFLIRSSRQFMSAYLKSIKNNWVGDDFNLHHSYKYYNEFLERLKVNDKQSKFVSNVIAAGMVLEMAGNLSEKAGYIEEGCQEYEKALEFFISSPLEKVQCLKKIISLKIKLEEYAESLKLIKCIMEEIKSFPDSGYKEDILCDTEIKQILLVLILQPTPQQIPRSAASALEKYAWVDTSVANEVVDLDNTMKNNGLSMLSPDIFLKLQSLVMACQYNDLNSLEFIESDLMPYLNYEQKTLLQVLIKNNRD